MWCYDNHHGLNNEWSYWKKAHWFLTKGTVVSYDGMSDRDRINIGMRQGYELLVTFEVVGIVIQESVEIITKWGDTAVVAITSE